MNRTKCLIEGIEILCTYNKYSEADVCTEHDIVYAGPKSHRTVGEQHARELEELGWFPDSETGRWAFFV